MVGVPVTLSFWPSASTSSCGALQEVAAAGASFDDVVRVAIYMTDLVNFAAVNEVMKRYFREPHPARSTIGVAALPRGAAVEIDLIAVIGG